MATQGRWRAEKVIAPQADPSTIVLGLVQGSLYSCTHVLSLERQIWVTMLDYLFHQVIHFMKGIS